MSRSRKSNSTKSGDEMSSSSRRKMVLAGFAISLMGSAIVGGKVSAAQGSTGQIPEKKDPPVKVTPDLIITGGEIVTMDSQMRVAEAVAVHDGRILAVGSRAEIMPLAGETTRIVDLGGRVLMPGFVEPHTHPIGAGMMRGDPTVDIRTATVPSYEAVLALVKRRISKAQPDEFVLFHGLDPLTHTGVKEPTRAELDALAPLNPIAIQTNSSHGMYLNTLAMKRFGIDRTTKSPVGGEVIKGADGEPTGKLVSTATDLVSVPYWSSLGAGRGAEVFFESSWKHARAGYTTTSELLVMPNFLPLLKQVADDQAFPIRIFGYSATNAAGTAVVAPGWGDDRIGMPGVKFFADGSPFVGNIWLTRPYLVNSVTVEAMHLPAGHTGNWSFTADEFTRQVDLYASKGWQVATHVQGDRTFDVVLDAYEKVIERHGLKDHRFRLEHCGLPSPQQIERAVKLGVSFSFFLPHLRVYGDVISDSLFGPERAAHYMPVGTAVRAGMQGVSLHCDTPSVDPNPILCLDLAVNRRSASGRVIGPDERVSVDDALRAITIWAAWQLKMDTKVGSIEPTKYADFTVLDRNPRSIPVQALGKLKVLGTWMAGREVWSS